MLENRFRGLSHCPGEEVMGQFLAGDVVGIWRHLHYATPAPNVITTAAGEVGPRAGFGVHWNRRRRLPGPWTRIPHPQMASGTSPAASHTAQMNPPPPSSTGPRQVRQAWPVRWYREPPSPPPGGPMKPAPTSSNVTTGPSGRASAALIPSPRKPQPAWPARTASPSPDLRACPPHHHGAGP